MLSNFKDLKKFGLESLNDIEIFETPKEEKQPESDIKNGVKVNTVAEADVLFDKSYKCPCCNKDFKAKAVRAGKTRLEKMDRDLRPVYQPCDVLKYDAIVCPRCGYAGLIKTFAMISDFQIRQIKEKISAKFKEHNYDSDTYSYEDAMERTQLALLSSIVKVSKASDKSYICLKLAWLCRGKRESLDKEAVDYKKQYEDLVHSELHNLQNAFQGFSDAYINENFPIAGMDEPTFCVLMGETARKLGKKAEALKYLGNVLTSKVASERLKDIARSIKEECSHME